MNKQKPELLAPAGSMESLTAALRCGADAVYLGAKQFSARAHAENFDADALVQAARLCHLYGARLWLAVNTLVFDGEFAALDGLLHIAAEAGADGFIVQDLGAAAYIAKRLPTLRLHASTQLTVHTPAGVRFAKQAGFCRVVLARELSRMQIAEIAAEARKIGMETEVFVHGAHCMCVSGQCLLSAAMGGRSANRGCCAQPCRLPFSADGSEAYALSLKDLSLTAHLDALREIGVDSLKIEGRMKRPEYVAAAVTAYRTLLDGGTPDLAQLQAVFSRSGFTDGYFTGKRREMFGTRQKADVTAAQEVLAPLRELYRKPRKAVQLHAHVTVRSGEAVSLVLTDGAQRVAVTGEVPQTAQNRPTDAAQIEKQLSKLGDTVYTLCPPETDIQAGLMLPASALNQLRRAGIAAMDAARIRANTPVHTLGDVPEMPQKAPLPAFGWRVQIRRMEQLAGLTDCADGIAYLLLPVQLAQEYAASAQPIPLSRVQLLLPRFTVSETRVYDMLKRTQELGYSHLACGGVGDIMLGRMLQMTLHGTLGLHVTNARAAGVLAQFGLADALCAPETPQGFSRTQALPLGEFVYGRLPLMLTRNCPVQHQVGCGRCTHTLIDRKGAAVYVDCTRVTDSPDYAELFNSVPVWRTGQPQAAYGLLSMTDEAPERVRAVLGAYLHGESVQPPAHSTRGLRVL